MSFSRVFPDASHTSAIPLRRRLARAVMSLMRCGAGLPPDERALRIEERLTLGGKKSVTLLICHGRRFLLATSDDVLTPMGEVLPLSETPTPCSAESLFPPGEEIFR